MNVKDSYIETFDEGPGGWYADRRYALPVWDGVAYCHSPWFLDANHAPPGAGYLHMLMWLYTHKRWYELEDRPPLPYVGNRFLDEGHPTDFTDARLTLRLRGQLDLKGSRLLLLVISQIRGKMVNQALHDQPFRVREDWSEQSVTLTPDPDMWTCLGGRHDLLDTRGCADIEEVLADVNVNILLILFPLQIAAAGAGVEDLHLLRAGADYLVDEDRLPKGLVMIDTVRIDFAQ